MGAGEEGTMNTTPRFLINCIRQDGRNFGHIGRSKEARAEEEEEDAGYGNDAGPKEKERERERPRDMVIKIIGHWRKEKKGKMLKR